MTKNYEITGNKANLENKSMIRRSLITSMDF